MSLIGFNREYQTVDSAFSDIFDTLIDEYRAAMCSTEPSRDGSIAGEIINACIAIKDPTQNIVTSSIRNMPMRYAVGELLWYLSGSNRLSDISNFSKAWEKLSDDGETVNSAYGFRIFEKFGFDQWKYVKEMLEKNPLSRQAVIHIKEPSNAATKDLPCTVALQYFIRGGALHTTTYMRSNDIWLGFPYDVFTFTSLQMMMAMSLGLRVGTYTHFAGSLHLYERNIPEYLKKDLISAAAAKIESSYQQENPTGVNLVRSEEEQLAWRQTMDRCLYSSLD